MSSMERIVRPFQLGEIFNARVLPPEQPPLGEPPENVLVEWEGGVDSNYIEEPSPVTMGFAVEWQEEVGKRVTRTVRVENPDDDTQYVDIEKIKTAVFRNNANGQTQTLRFADDPA